MGPNFAVVSIHSRPGSEPATMPAPAWRTARSAADPGAPEGDGELAVARCVDPADRSPVEAARPSFEPADQG